MEKYRFQFPDDPSTKLVKIPTTQNSSNYDKLYEDIKCEF